MIKRIQNLQSNIELQYTNEVRRWIRMYTKNYRIGSERLLGKVAIYFPLFEEPQLRSRFGEEYRLYCNNVGRWVPRIGPWKPPESLHRGVQ